MYEFRVDGPPSKGELTPDELRQWEIRADDDERDGAPLAVTRVQVAGERAPMVWMYGAADGSPLGCVRPLVQSVDEPADRFEVCAADGAPLGVIRYERWRLWPWPRRYRWVVRLADGGKVVGAVGTWYAWTLFLVLLPIWGPLLLILTIGAAFEGNGLSSPDEMSGVPSRIRWFRSGRRGWAMDRSGAVDTYRLRSELLDYRIAYALGLASAWNSVARLVRRRRT